MKYRIELTAICRDEPARLAMEADLDATPRVGDPLDFDELARFQRNAQTPRVPIVSELREPGSGTSRYAALVHTTPFLFSGTVKELMDAFGHYRCWRLRVFDADLGDLGQPG